MFKARHVASDAAMGDTALPSLGCSKQILYSGAHLIAVCSEPFVAQTDRRSLPWWSGPESCTLRTRHGDRKDRVRKAVIAFLPPILAGLLLPANNRPCYPGLHSTAMCCPRVFLLPDESMPNGGEIDFWFSIGSTYTYLTVWRLCCVEANKGVRFRWRPFSLRSIIQEM